MCDNGTTEFKVQGLARAQLEFLGVGVEVSLEIGNADAVGMLIVNAQSTAHIDVFNTDAMTFQLTLQVVDAVTESFEVTHVEYLATDVEV